MSKNIFLRCAAFAVLAVLCLAVFAAPAMAVDVYHEADNSDMFWSLIYEANIHTADNYTIAITENYPIGYEGEGFVILGNVTLTTNKTHPHTLSLLYPVSMFTIENGGKLTMCGNNSNELKLQGLDTNTESLIVVNDGGTLTMQNGAKLTGNSNTGNGGAVTVNSGGVFGMEGGEISGNTAQTYGGGVFVNGGVFTMSGGDIIGNSAKFGGGVSVIADGRFCMSGETLLSSNSATSGGGIFIENSMVEMSGGAISGNTNNWGVYVGGGRFTMSGGTITENGNGVYITRSTTAWSIVTVEGSAEIIGNEESNIYNTGEGFLDISGKCTGSIGVGHGRQKYKDEIIQFAAGVNGYTITAEDAKHFFADDSINYSVQLREDGLYLVSKIIKVQDTPTPSGTVTWISAPADSKLGSGIIDNPNGGKVNFPAGFPFSAVAIGQAGEVTQSSPSSAESDFPESDTRQILSSADITASPAIPSDGAVLIEFSVASDKIPEGYTIGVYHGVASGTNSPSDTAYQNAMAEAKKVIEETSAVIDEVKRVLEKYNYLDALSTSDLLEAYYEVMDAAKKAKEASQKAGDAERNVLLNDRETQDEAHKASNDAWAAAAEAERVANVIAEKLGYVPPERTEGGGVYAWKVEKVIETGRSDGLVHYAVEATGLSPFIIVVEKEAVNTDVDTDPVATPTPTETESPGFGVLAVLAGLCAVAILRRK